MFGPKFSLFRFSFLGKFYEGSIFLKQRHIQEDEDGENPLEIFTGKVLWSHLYQLALP